MPNRTMSDIFRNVFDTPDGRTMLYWIANECGFFQANPDKIRPELLAFFNRLMAVGGVTAPARAGALMENLMIVAAKPITDTRRDDDILE